MSPKELLADSLYGSDDNVTKAKQDFETDVLAPLMGAKSKGFDLEQFTLDSNNKLHFVRKVISPVVLKNQKTDSSRNSAVQIVVHVLNWQTVRSPNTRKHTHITTTKK